jgi:DNA-directed RNA polymerase subunit omega
MAIETPENSFQNKYSLVKGAARRARQLQSGAPPMMASKSIKACRVAQDEISQGRVTYVVQKVMPKPPIEPGI